MRWVSGKTLEEEGHNLLTDPPGRDFPGEAAGTLSAAPIEEDEEVRRAKKRAMDLLTARDYTEARLREKLLETGKARGGRSDRDHREVSFSPQAVEEAIAYVRSFGYLNDARYARSYVRCHMEKASRLKIRNELLSRGVAEETVSEALEETYGDLLLAGEDPELAQIKKLLNKRGFDRETTPFEERQKILAAAARRGFSADKVRRAMED